MQRYCPVCFSQFDYYTKKATIVCSSNHVLCEKCAELYARQFKNCPTCNQPVFNNNPSRFSDDASRQAQQNNYEYPRYENNNPINPYGNNADAQPYNHERPASGKNPIMLIGIACICVIVFIVLLVLRIKMNKCQFWGEVSCYDSFFREDLCCPSTCNSSNCTFISLVQNSGAVIAVTMGLVLSLFVALVCLCRYCSVRRAQNQLQYANYAYAN